MKDKLPKIGGWNYRVGEKNGLFSIIEVYYNDKGQPKAYAERNPTANWEDYEDLKGTIDLIKQAFKRPVLDIKKTFKL